MSPIPSLSVSLVSFGSNGNLSKTSGTPSLSSSGSVLFGKPSPSKSADAPPSIPTPAFIGFGSVASPIPSPSVSGLFGSVPIMSSSASDKKSLSLSLGVLLESLGLEPP